MQAVIMAAGCGTRLRSIIGYQPKSLAKVGKKYIIDWILESFSDVNIEPIIMIVGFQHDQLEKHLADKGIKFIFNPFFKFGQVLSSFFFAIDHISTSKDLIFCHADTIFEPMILNKLFKAEGEIILPFDRHECDDEAMKIKLDQKGYITEINKEINIKKSDGEFIGLALVRKSFIPKLLEISKKLIVEGNLDAYFEQALQVASNRSLVKLQGLDISGMRWCEIDSPEDLEIARSIKWG